MAGKSPRTIRIRQLRVDGGLPVLLAAALVPAAASCSGSTSVSEGAGGAGAAGGTTSTTTSSSSSTGIGGFGIGGSSSSGTGGAAGLDCGPASVEETFMVEVPPEGTPLDQICPGPTDPVTSNPAARVTLTKYSEAVNLATGFVELDPGLLADVVGLPTVAAIEAWDGQLLDMQVSQIAATAGGFSFHAEWPQPFWLPPNQYSRVTVQTTFELQCGPNQSKTVQAITHVHLCIENGDVVWISSGDMCTACGMIAEMAPSPIVPADGDDPLPLARALRLRLVPLAQVGRSLLLLAENDGGEGLRYDWQPSAGELVEVAADIVIWTPPEEPGPHLLQVAVSGDDTAAVAGMRWGLAA